VNKDKNIVNLSTGPHFFPQSTDCSETTTPATQTTQLVTPNDNYHKSRLSTSSLNHSNIASSSKSKRRFKSLPNMQIMTEFG
jgi:hypothetical protein